jgi:predicted glutamine amidotransferase
MCRLFGMNAGAAPVRATFWLLQSPDSLSTQSLREPDGTGLGWFDAAGAPVIAKAPLAAHADPAFARQAREVRSPTFVAHVRYATTGALEVRNTHPFTLEQRIFAHNGMIGDLPALERELGPDRSRVGGDTDSERFFALITREIDRDGDVTQGIAAAARWIAAHLPVLALNFVMAAAGELWALRYPEVHPLFVLERDADGGALAHDRGGRIRAASDELAQRPAVVIATEQMDGDPDWQPIPSGELLHVDRDLRITRRRILDEPPAHPLTLAELEGHAAAAQRA